MLLLLLAGLVGLVAVGVGMRRVVLQAQYRAADRVLPFTLESALHFRRIWTIQQEGALPVVDRAVQHPDGVRVAETYTVGSEYGYAWLADRLPEPIPLSERVRWIEAGWFCLGIPLVALWAGLLFRSGAAGAVSGLLYAVCVSGLIRSTGQELSRENFALPWLIGFLLLEQVAGRTDRPGKGAWVAAVGAGLCLALALISWDMVQYAIGLWMLVRGWELLRGRWHLLSPAGGRWLCSLGMLVVVGLVNPYLRSHGFLASPLMGLGYGLTAAGALASWGRAGVDQGGEHRGGGAGHGRISPWGLALLALLPVVLALAAGEVSGASYGHFGSLLKAKIVHLNQKPADPSKLNFDQRIMWVPALHSATPRLTVGLFPAILPLGILSGVLMCRSSRDRGDPRVGHLIFFTVSAFLTFCLFVRFHVFVALFGSVLIGGLGAWAWSRRGVAGWGMVGLLILGIVVEAGQILRQPAAWGRTGVYYTEVMELVEWLKASAKPDPVLANFGTSGMVLAYGGCPIVLHPKFEGQAIRDRVREYGEALFTGTEISFRDWALDKGARYYVYGKGEFAEIGVPCQMRYFVNALDPPATAPARLFDKKDAELTWFLPVWENRKYKVYRIRSEDDERSAALWAEQAERCFQRGDVRGTERAAREALVLNPYNDLALKMLRHAENLLDAGFGYEPE